MTNPIGSKAASVLGSARQTLKQMAEAAAKPPEEKAASPETPPHVKSRQGRTLDRYA
ncbi:hypothetical protein ACTI_78700 [Actinoplanes sp. OR16]|uniref:hypothetical protein n=1 Tax=Actinoplanes sp. OR16 TaxID=946334 RepID=UPI000F6D1694|nr:hypothetical protein [Actinoplanes sp. OR16]BBH71185.1 hypothetical protein ACTI_78700 [Actinoplanes sp. OR16]